MAARSGRTGTSHSRYRRTRAVLLAQSDLCHLCGHYGARTADHIVPWRDWPPGVPGFDDLANLRPAHGTLGRFLLNRCPECVARGRSGLCNQERGDRPIEAPRPQTRQW